MSFLTFTTLTGIHSRENKKTEDSSFSQDFGVSASASFFKKNDGAFLSHYKQVCSYFDINQLLPPSSSHFPLLLHGFVLKQCTSFLSLLPNYQQEPSQGSALHKPTLERKEKNQQKQPLQTVNSKNVVWQHIWSICLLRKYSCCPGDTAGYWRAWPLDSPSRGTPTASMCCHSCPYPWWV